MQITAPINSFSNGFSTQDDIFGRVKLHKFIMRVAKNAPDKSLVLALDDKWGNGKTSFVQMMQSEIKINHSDDFDVIYFDAFKSDYQSDPFVALTASIYSLINKDEGKLKSLSKELLDIGKKLGAAFAINGAKFAISTLSGGLLTGTNLEKAGEVITDSISSSVEKYIEEKIKTSENELATIERFGEVLTEIHKESGRKIIFIIDELDRARPDFSLDLLEKIKHIFSVQGVIFLLVINREQFEKSVECRYGNINSRLYLNKFVHYWFSLPKQNYLSPECVNSINHTTTKKYLLSIDKGNNLLTRNGKLLNTLSYLIDVNECSLREAERCYSVFTVIDSPNKIHDYSTDYDKVALALVAFLKVHNTQLLSKLVYKTCSTEDLLMNLSVTLAPPYDIPELYILNNLLQYHFATDEQLIDFRGRGKYSDLEGGYGRRVRIFEPAFEMVEGFEVGY